MLNGHKAAAKPRSTASRTGIAVLTSVPGHCRKGDSEGNAVGRVPVLLAISPCASGGTWHRVIQPKRLDHPVFVFLHKNKNQICLFTALLRRSQLKTVGVGVGSAVSASDEDVRGLPGEK